MKRDIIESDDSDNDITNLNNIPPRQRLETETENENDKVKMKPQPLPVNQEMTDYKFSSSHSQLLPLCSS